MVPTVGDTGAFLGRIWRFSNVLADGAQMVGFLLAVAASAVAGVKLGLPWGLVVFLAVFGGIAVLAGRQCESDLRKCRTKPVEPSHRTFLMGVLQHVLNRTGQDEVAEIKAHPPSDNRLDETAEHCFGAHFPDLVADLSAWNESVSKGAPPADLKAALNGHFALALMSELPRVDACRVCRGFEQGSA
jgi:hypothetical protein